MNGYGQVHKSIEAIYQKCAYNTDMMNKQHLIVILALFLFNAWC